LETEINKTANNRFPKMLPKRCTFGKRNVSVTKNEKQIMNASNNNENLGIMKSFIIKVYFYNPYIISFLCMMALMPIWISIPEKYNPVYFFALPTGAVFFFAALELLKLATLKSV